MPFAEVTLDKNGNKTLTPITESTSTTAADALAIAEKALPKTGGEMTGALTIKGTLGINAREIDAVIGETTTSAAVYLGSDTGNSVLGILEATYNQNRQQSDISLSARAIQNGPKSFLSLVIPKEGQAYATAPHPRPDNYGTDLVTTKAMKDWALMKLTDIVDIHINSETGSDTVGLFIDRGLSAEKPFKSIQAAHNWAVTNYGGPNYIRFILHSDMDLTYYPDFYLHNLNGLIIMSDSTIRTLNLQQNALQVRSGQLYIQNLKLVSSNGPSFCCAAGFRLGTPVVRLGGSIELSGQVSDSSVIANYGGQISIEPSCTLSGTVTGKRYAASRAGRIFTQGKTIPGTEDGTCDASSIVAA